MNKLIYVLLLAGVISSCGEYQKALKSEDVAVKYEAATKLYEAEKYKQSDSSF